MRVFLTGGSGLVGSHVAERLCEEGHRIVAFQRPGSDSNFLKALGCEIRSGDLRDEPERMAETMAGCQGLVHTAALTYPDASWEAVREVNVEGTARILRAAKEASIRSVVHVSTVAVYGNEPGIMDERSPIDTPLLPSDLYARSKREAEAEVLRSMEGGGPPVTVLRPSVVYGERDRMFIPRILKSLWAPVGFVLGSGETTLPAVYAGNLAGAVVLALGGGGRGVYNVAADHKLTQPALMTALLRARGRKARLIRLPAGLLLGGARLLDAVGFRVPGARELPIVRIVRLSVTDNPYPSDLIRRELGWSPRYSLDEALDRSARWFARPGVRTASTAVRYP